MKKIALALTAATLAVSGAVVASTVSSASTSASTATPIGYQHGIEAARLRMKKLDPAGFNASGTGAWDKYFRTMRILVADHDAAIVASPPPTTTTAPPPPTTTAPAVRPAPQTYNRGTRGQDARYCLPDGVTVDAAGYRYDEDGRSLGGRTGNDVPGLKPSDAMDGASPCAGYSWGNQTFPPWPDASYLP
jgi:hypothetical protein